MNKNFYYSIILSLAVSFCTANEVFAMNSSVIAQIKPVAVKLGLAMMAVVLFSILLTVGLSLYNKFFVPANVQDCKLNKDSLRTPSDKNEAVMLYITKNGLK